MGKVRTVVLGSLLGLAACSSSAELVEPSSAQASREAKAPQEQAPQEQAPLEQVAQQAPQGQAPQQRAGEGGAMVAKMVEGEVYSGRVHLRAELGDKFPPKYVEGGALIRTQAEYESFVGRIPTHEVSMTNPAPESDDPLLKLPAVDFSKVSLVVYERDSMYVGPELGAPRQEGGKWRVSVAFPDEGGAAMAARVYGVGTYQLKVVARVEGELTFDEVQRKPAKP